MGLLGARLGSTRCGQGNKNVRLNNIATAAHGHEVIVKSRTSHAISNYVAAVSGWIKQLLESIIQ